MTPADESELDRLSELVRQIDHLLPPHAPEREALVKAGFALIQVFLSGGRPLLEEMFSQRDAPLTEEQLAHLAKLGLKP